MTEKVLNNRKNGMLVLILTIAGLLAGVLLFLAGVSGAADGVGDVLLSGLGVLIMAFGWIPFLGLKVLRPKEALVLTLFGKYIGTLKDDGFYFVNPFCVSVNPAAKTRLGQSGDVDSGSHPAKIVLSKEEMKQEIAASKKISLKDMTLSNAKQKVNDVLGNPVEIGVAVIWRVQDTAKAVFKDRKSTRLNSSHTRPSRMPSSA